MQLELKVLITLVLTTVAVAAPAEVAPKNEIRSRSDGESIKDFFDTLFRSPAPPSIPPVEL